MSPTRRRAASAAFPVVPKPEDIVDRDREWAELADAWHRPEPALLVGVGRRRAGKSWVLSRFADAVGGLYYQATRRTEAEQLAALSRIVAEHVDDAALRHGGGFATWEALFAYLAERAGGAPYLLVLDEFPYLVDAAPSLPSIIQAAWDHDWPTTRIRLVLNGSHISAMTRLEAHDQPLYGRRTGRLRFPPFGVEHVRAFVPAYDARDLIRTWAIVGGLPGHLALLRPEDTLADNVARLVLDPGGRLADEAEHLLDAFLGDADVHYSVLQAIARGERSWSKITNRVGKPGGSLSRPMRWLEEMQLVAKHVPITEDPRTSRRGLYRLTDPYVAFWHRFVAPLVASGETSILDPHVLWETRVAPGLDVHLGHVFEDVCRAWVARAHRLPFRPTRVGAWWDGSAANEVDVVAIGDGPDLLVAECKWGVVGDDDLQTLRERAAMILAELPPRLRAARLHLACFSARGEWGPRTAAEIAAGTVLGFTAEDVVAID